VVSGGCQSRIDNRLWVAAATVRDAGRNVRFMTGDQPAEQVAVRLDFVAQENVLHEQLTAITAELAEARQRDLSAEQWQAALAHLVDLCDAVTLFSMRLRELVRPDA
jgi:hypothetical protein